jgi:hypothetical protein
LVDLNLKFNRDRKIEKVATTSMVVIKFGAANRELVAVARSMKEKLKK